MHESSRKLEDVAGFKVVWEYKWKGENYEIRVLHDDRTPAELSQDSAGPFGVKQTVGAVCDHGISAERARELRAQMGDKFYFALDPRRDTR